METFYTISNAGKAAPSFGYIFDSGAVIITDDNIAQTGQWRPLTLSDLQNISPITVSGGSITIAGTVNATGLMRVTGSENDFPSGYGMGSFLPVGGRAVNSETFMPQYGSGANVESNFDKDNGGLLVNQGCLNRNIDNITVWYSGSDLANNTSAGSFGTNTPTNGILFNANAARTEFFIQAMGTGIPTYIKFGGAASAQSFSVLLNPATAAGRAGDSFRDERWRGSVYISGGAVSAFEI